MNELIKPQDVNAFRLNNVPITLLMHAHIQAIVDSVDYRKQSTPLREQESTPLMVIVQMQRRFRDGVETNEDIKYVDSLNNIYAEFINTTTPKTPISP